MGIIFDLKNSTYLVLLRGDNLFRIGVGVTFAVLKRVTTIIVELG